MRLLNVDTFEFLECNDEPPPYVVASHRWTHGTEASLKDVRKKRNIKKPGYQKVEGFAAYVRAHIPNVSHLWIDTVCVDQTSSQEVSEAVNSMFRLYSNSEACLAYIADITADSDGVTALGQSKWFTRGWTLQELLAPSTVIFLTQKWDIMGHKGVKNRTCSGAVLDTGPPLGSLISSITGVPESVLQDYKESLVSPVEEKFKWMNGRETTRAEDLSYCLLGIFDVHMAIRYGEGKDEARRRLRKKIGLDFSPSTIPSEIARREYFDTLDWICKRDQDSTIHKDSLSTADQWFLQSARFRAWTIGEESLLWCYGHPGCGKTVLASRSVRYVKDSLQGPSTALLTLFCKFDENLTCDNANASFLRQLARQPLTRYQTLTLSTGLIKLYQDQCKATKQAAPQPSEVRNALQHEIERFSKVYVVLDGLDEIGETERIRLLDSIWSMKPKPQLMVFSRELPEIREWFEGAITDEANAHPTLEILPTTQSLELYVKHRISSSPVLQRIVKMSKSKSGKELGQEIVEVVSQNASETFLLAELHMNALIEDPEIRSPRDVRAALEALRNASFASAYDAVFDRIQKVCGTVKMYSRLLKFFIIVSQTKEPLPAPAVEHAMAIEPGEVDEDFEDNIASAKEYASLCAGLVVIDGNNTVRLAHKTIGEYLTERLQRDVPRLDAMLARICLTYLRLPLFEGGSYAGAKADDRAQQRILTYPFLPYASRFWGRHARGNLDGKVAEETLAFCTNAGLVNSAAQAMRLSDICQSQRPWDVDHGITGLHLCAYFGLPETVESLLEFEAVDHTDQHGTTPLMYAIQEQNQATVSTLLCAGADTSRACRRGSTALHRACQSYHEKIWTEMVSVRGDIAVSKACTEPFWADKTALSWAIGTGDPHRVDLLLLRSDLEVISTDAQCYLQMAARCGHYNILDSLLKDHRVIGKCSSDGEILRKTFFTAARFGQVKCAEILIQHGVDADARDRFGATAIMRTVDANDDESFLGFKFLFEKADRHVNDMLQRGILHSAALSCNYRATQYILENDADFNVNAQGQGGETPLHDATKDQDGQGKHAVAECVRLLVKFGADITIKDRFSKTPVDKARENGQTDLLALFGEPEAELPDYVEEKITSYSLMVAIKRESDLDLLQHLQRWTQEDLQHASNWIDPQESITQDTALVAAIKERKLQSASYLLDCGADPDGLDRFHRTALHYAAMTGNIKLAQQLLRLGAKVNVRDNVDRATPVSFAARSGHLNLALYLIAQGDGHTAKSIQRKSLPELLGLACEQGNMTVIERLVAEGAPLMSKNQHNRTPRDRAKMKCHHDVVEYIDNAIGGLEIEDESRQVQP